MRKFISFLVYCLLVISPAFAQDFDSPSPDTTVYYPDDTSLMEETPRVRKYPARLWEITGNGLKQPSYLYGTMHVSKKLAFNLGDTFYKALQSVDVVALELAIDSWLSNIGQNGNDISYGFNKYGMADGYGRFYKSALSFDGTSLPSLLGELGSEDYMSNFLLYRQGYQSPDYSEKTYVDLYIHQTGKKLNKFCTGLEDFEISRRMVSRADWRERTFPRAINYDSYYGDYGYGEDPSEKAYREGDLDMIDSLEKKDNPDIHFLKWMLYERNKVMADQIEAITKTKKLFAAVGCAHLPGDSGVIEFLRRKGFTLTPIYDNIGEYAFKQKQKLENTTTPVTFKKYVSHTGELSYELPGKPLDRSYGNTEDIFYADVANGAYYVLKKLPWYGQLEGKSQEKLLKQLDSALYENIPGDITERSKTTIGGYPAIDVSNSTKTGETQRHLYIIMPNHIWYIKLSAAGNYAQGKEAKDFFKSISLQPASTKWAAYSPECGGYQLNWPTPVVLNRVSFDTSTNLKGHVNLEYTDEKKNYYFLKTISIPYYGFDEDTFHLHQIANNYAYYNKGKVEEVSFRDINGHKAMQTTIRFKDKDLYLHILFAVDMDLIYTTGVFTSAKKAPNDFLNSFQFVPFKYKYNPVKDYDPIAKMSYSRPDWKPIKDQFKLYNEEYEIAHKEIKYPESYGYSYSDLSEYFRDTLMADYRYAYPITFPSGENVSINAYTTGRIASKSNWEEFKKRGILVGNIISMSRYHQYFDSLENYWDSVNKKDIVATYTYELENTDILDTVYFNNGFLVSESITHMPGTSYIDYNKSITGEFVTYNVSTRYDKSRGMSDKVKEVIQSIENDFPNVSVLDSNAFANLLIGLFSSADSIDLFKAADYGWYTSVIPKRYNDTLFQLLKKFDKNKLYGQNYTPFIESKLINDNYLPLIGYYMDKYRRGGDTSEIQANMLANLGSLRNSEALDSLMYWLLEETPLAPEGAYNTYIYSGIINRAFDTLELWKDRYAKLLPLNRYSEYEDAIMSLGLTLLDSNMLDSSVFIPLIPELTLGFRDDLKRKMSKPASRGYDYGYDYSSGQGDYHDPDNFTYGIYYNGLFGNNTYYYGDDYASDVAIDYAAEYSLQPRKNTITLSPSDHLLSQQVTGSYPGYARAPLSANRFGGYDGYGGYGGSSNSLYDKAKLLIRFYNQSPDVAKRLRRVYAMQDKEEKMQFIHLYLKNKIGMPDTMFQHYLKEKDCQYGFVKMLQKYKINDSIPAGFFEEKNLVNSFMYYHHFEKKDTVIFLGKRSAPIEKEEGQMYFYKHRNKEDKSQKKDDNWLYSYIWIGKMDTLTTMKMPRYYRFNISVNKKQTVKEMMATEASRLEYWKHPIWEALVPEDENMPIYDTLYK